MILTTPRRAGAVEPHHLGGRYPRTGRADDDLTPWAGNTWTAPETPGDLWITVILRDDRGGVGAATWWLTVTEP